MQNFLDDDEDGDGDLDDWLSRRSPTSTRYYDVPCGGCYLGSDKVTRDDIFHRGTEQHYEVPERGRLQLEYRYLVMYDE